MAYAIKAALADAPGGTIELPRQKTMYGGKAIAAGDAVFLFASETSGGRGLVARGVVVHAAPVPRLTGVARQTPRVSVVVRVTAPADRPLGRETLRAFTAWDDGRPETELNFKFYRQATDKVVGLSDAAAAFLDGFFPSPEDLIETAASR